MGFQPEAMEAHMDTERILRQRVAWLSAKIFDGLAQTEFALWQGCQVCLFIVIFLHHLTRH